MEKRCGKRYSRFPHRDWSDISPGNAGLCRWSLYCSEPPHPPPTEQLPQALPPVLSGVSGSTEKPIYEKLTVTWDTCASSSLFMQNLYPFSSAIVSVSFGSSRANAKRGPLQPPGARNTRILDGVLPAKYASSSFFAASVTVIIITEPPKNSFFNPGKWGGLLCQPDRISGSVSTTLHRFHVYDICL